MLCLPTGTEGWGKDGVPAGDKVTERGSSNRDGILLYEPFLSPFSKQDRLQLMRDTR